MKPHSAVPARTSFRNRRSRSASPHCRRAQRSLDLPAPRDPRGGQLFSPTATSSARCSATAAWDWGIWPDGCRHLRARLDRGLQPRAESTTSHIAEQKHAEGEVRGSPVVAKSRTPRRGGRVARASTASGGWKGSTCRRPERPPDDLSRSSGPDFCVARDAQGTKPLYDCVSKPSVGGSQRKDRAAHCFELLTRTIATGARSFSFR